MNATNASQILFKCNHVVRFNISNNYVDTWAKLIIFLTTNQIPLFSEKRNCVNIDMLITLFQNST